MSAGPTDAELVSSLRRRRPGAFDELFRRYKERVWRFLAHLTRRPDWAEDLFQETWLAAARNAHNLREDTALLPWLLTIARNKHRNGLRFFAYERQRRAGVEAQPAPATAAPDEGAHARQVAARVAAAWDTLPTAHREVLLLATQEGLGSGEIARVLGLREDAVRKRLSRARAELARMSGFDPKDRTTAEKVA